MFTLADRVQETCTAPGTGIVTLLGAVTQYQSFSAGIGANNTTYYTIADQTGSNWEVGLGTIGATGLTLTRTTILASSNAGSVVNFSVGTQNIWCDYPAGKAVYGTGTTLVAPTGTLLPVANGGTGVGTSTGSGSNVLSTSPTLVTPLLGTPTSGVLTTCTGYTYANLSGTVPTWNQNTTGQAGSVANSVTFNNVGTGAASGTAYNGSVAQTISYNTVGAQVAGTYVTSVTGTAPVVSSGGTTPAISMAAATTSISGYLTSTDWNTFNGKQAAGSYVTVGGALGTPSSGTLTNCTFPTLNQNTTGSSGSCTGNSATATGLTASNYITSNGSTGNLNTDFQNTTAYTYRWQGDFNSGTNAPAVGWWFAEDMRHSNASNYWGTQVCWGWEDNANRLMTRNVSSGSYAGWIEYLNTSGRTFTGSLIMSGSVTATNTAKAWVNFNGATGAIRKSFNVASITRNSTGNYTLNFASALPDTNYAPCISYGSYSTGGTIIWISVNQTTNTGGATLKSTTQLLIVCSNGTGVPYDNAEVYVAIFD